MPTEGQKLDGAPKSEVESFRADLKAKFGRNLIGYCVAVPTLLVISNGIFTVVIGCLWTAQLLMEANTAFFAKVNTEGPEFGRWIRRQDWVRAKETDNYGVERLRYPH